MTHALNKRGPVTDRPPIETVHRSAPTECLDGQVGQMGLAVALVRLSHLVQRVFGEVSRGYDLTPQQTQLLCRLIDGPVRMAELSQMLDLEKSSLTGLVDRVEKRGLVTRTRSHQDRRAYQVTLTDQGQRVGVDTHASVIAQLETLIGDVADADRQHLTTLIAHMLGSSTGVGAANRRPNSFT